jgi:hypothetical protein
MRPGYAGASGHRPIVDAKSSNLREFARIFGDHDGIQRQIVRATGPSLAEIVLYVINKAPADLPPGLCCFAQGQN